MALKFDDNFLPNNSPSFQTLEHKLSAVLRVKDQKKQGYRLNKIIEKFLYDLQYKKSAHFEGVPCLVFLHKDKAKFRYIAFVFP